MNKEKINSITRKLGFEVHGTGYIQQVKKSSFREDPFQIQKDLLGHASVIIDGGANRGDTVQIYRDLFPSARIHAIEPFKDSFDILQSRATNQVGVYPHQMALSDQNGTSTLYVNKSVDTNSLLPSAKSGMSSDTQVETQTKVFVPTITLDELAERSVIKKIDILKLDIQGGELLALKGAHNLLSTKSIKLIYLEVWFVRQYIDSPLYHHIAAFLEPYGYFTQDLYNPIYANGSIAWADAMFMPR